MAFSGVFYAYFIPLAVFSAYFIPLFLLIKYGRADKFTKRFIVNKNSHEVIQIFNNNIRDLSISVKILLLMTNIIYPSHKNWAGKVDWYHQTCEITRIPRWYDINPFSVKFSCEVRQQFQQSVILVKPLITRKSLFVSYVIMWSLYLLLEEIQGQVGNIFYSNFLDMLHLMQGVLIWFFPISFYIEWRVSQSYLKTLFERDLVAVE